VAGKSDILNRGLSHQETLACLRPDMPAGLAAVWQMGVRFRAVDGRDAMLLFMKIFSPSSWRF
jgi:hypothetical protein